MASAILETLAIPIVLAPLAGGPATPELTAAACDAGGLGFVASGYLSAEQTATALARTRASTTRALGVNVFVPSHGPSPTASYADYLERVRAWARERELELGTPRYDDDDWQRKIELLASEPVEVVSFTFGSPPRAVLRRLKAAGSETWVTVTTPDEAREAVSAGADALVVQGAEAGGHRASFVDRPGAPLYGLLPLLQLVRAAVDAPLVAAGGIATGAGVAAALAAGAEAAALGTAFMLCPEAGTAPAHRAAIASDTPTALTRSFTGRLARGVCNAFMSEHEDAPAAYPEIHHFTAPLRRRARERGDGQVINLWAGEAHALARALPAAQIVKQLMSEVRAREVR
jgi:nitronate monooxygenase